MFIAELFKGKPAALHVQVPERVAAGEAFAGCVYADVRSECNATELRIEIIGEEYAHTHWTTTHTTGTGKNRRTHVRHHHAYARRRLLELDVPLASYGGGSVLPGKYAHPFQVTLPVNLPESMVAHGGGGDCAIRYYVHARFYRPERFVGDVRANAPMTVVAAPILAQVMPAFLQPDTQSVNFCCCVNRGEMTLGAAVSDTAVCRGATINATVALLNESTTEVEMVKVGVHEMIRWFAGGHSNSQHTTVSSSSIDPRSLHGAQNRDKEAMKAIKQQKKANPAAARAVAYGHVHATLGRSTSIPSRVSPGASYSYAGSVLAVAHRLQMVAETACCITNPKIECDMRIVPEVPGVVPVVIAQPAVQVSAPPTQLAQPGVPLEPDACLQPGAPAQVDAPSAPPVPENFLQQPSFEKPVELDIGKAVLGGNATSIDGEQDAGGDVGALVGVTQETLAVAPSAAPSVQALLQEMERTYDDFALLSAKLADDHWRAVIEGMVPADFGRVVKCVSLTFDQARVAELVGRVLAEKGTLTCAHTAQALQASQGLSRQLVLKALAPLCVDLESDGALIVSVLTEWERVLARDIPGLVVA